MSSSCSCRSTTLVSVSIDCSFFNNFFPQQTEKKKAQELIPLYSFPLQTMPHGRFREKHLGDKFKLQAPIC